MAKRNVGNRNMAKSVAESLEEKIEDKKQIIKLKTELIEKEYKNNLEENLKERLDNLIGELANLGGSPSIIEIKNLICFKRYTGIPPKYNNTELALLFEYYKEFITEINKVTQYIPTKQNFCNFIGISTLTYKNYLVSDDEERREIIQQIEDYLTDVMLSSAQKGEIREVTTMFRTKTEHGYVEAQAPIVVEHKATTDIEDIRKQIAAVNQGRSLKDINLEKDSDGIYK